MLLTRRFVRYAFPDLQSIGKLSLFSPFWFARECLMDRLVRAGLSHMVCSESKGSKGFEGHALSITQLYPGNSNKHEMIS